MEFDKRGRNKNKELSIHHKKKGKSRPRALIVKRMKVFLSGNKEMGGTRHIITQMQVQLYSLATSLSVISFSLHTHTHTLLMHTRHKGVYITTAFMAIIFDLYILFLPLSFARFFSKTLYINISCCNCLVLVVPFSLSFLLFEFIKQ